MSLLFALVSETRLLSTIDLWRMKGPLERSAAQCADVWGLAPPAIEVADNATRLPAWAHPVVFVDDSKDPGALAVHYYDPVRGGPACRVYVPRSTGMNEGSQSLFESADHEIKEALCNGRLDIWLEHPDPMRAGVWIPREVADSGQDTYELRYGTAVWQAANFVTPYWFLREFFVDEQLRRRLRGSGRGFDFAGRLSMPGELGAAGYVVLRAHGNDGCWRVWAEWSDGTLLDGSSEKLTERKRNALRHAMSRCRQLGLEL